MLSKFRKKFSHRQFLRSDPAYPYKLLEDAAGDIRLITLYAGNLEDLQVRIWHVSRQTHPVYEALSYVWGKPGKKVRIFALHDDSSTTSEHQVPVWITPNLHEALMHLRQPSEHRIFWIDALCINQKDDREKAKQIQIMPDIYSSASRVTVWLGPEQNGSANMILGMKLLSTRYTLKNGDPIIRPGTSRITPSSEGYNWYNFFQRLVKEEGPILYDDRETQTMLSFISQSRRLLLSALGMCNGDQMLRDGSTHEITEQLVMMPELLRKEAIPCILLRYSVLNSRMLFLHVVGSPLINARSSHVALLQYLKTI